MSRRIAYVIAIATCAAFVAPASADRECFENTCRMPEVVEPPDAPVLPSEETAVAAGAVTAVKKQEPERLPPAPEPARPRTTADQRRPAPEPVRPQMIVDQLPRPAPKPAPHRAAERENPALQDREPRESGPIEIVGRRYAAVEASAYAPYPTQPGAGVVVVVPGVQYGAGGVALAEGRQSGAWRLCQHDRPGNGRCTPYDYQPYGPYGYRPLGSYRPQRSLPAHVYVPDAKIIHID
jgi:hypothetical protein